MSPVGIADRVVGYAVTGVPGSQHKRGILAVVPEEADSGTL
ncbi:hypothetical protein FHR32_002139 [Streptosporangium album]|uniref:Uncharacterized protein n=1 Tax=Streptosporangium album TaxID=47479 RepID=A0A7W7RTB0_9ACTN|nr:hypothetical protein [Streptosporangium album]MBB4937834.1 hypothetical protein [Streptosporangium album]